MLKKVIKKSLYSMWKKVIKSHSIVCGESDKKSYYSTLKKSKHSMSKNVIKCQSIACRKNDKKAKVQYDETSDEKVIVQYVEKSYKKSQYSMTKFFFMKKSIVQYVEKSDIK